MNINQPPNGIVVFLLGAIGSVAQEIVRLYGNRLRLRRRAFPASYFLISIVYMLLAGVFAMILPAVNYYAAFYAGISMPVTLSYIAKHRHGVVALTNEAPIQCSEPPEPSRWQRLKNLVQDHADRLFF